jgi:homoserine dehydrogenase
MDRADDLRALGIGWRITGVASRRMGWLANGGGFDPGQLGDNTVAGALPANDRDRISDVRSWLVAAGADVLFEATSLNVENGEPAADHLRAALEHGAHAITANKGPVVHAYAELKALAQRQRRSFLFESTVMDGIPIFSLFRENLPLLRLQGFRGILNSTTNVILGGMEEGLSFEESLCRAQDLGVAETDARHDVDGWDAAVKVAALVIVLMGEPIKLSAIKRQGIRELTGEQVREARTAGTPFKLVCEAKRTGQGIEARVEPERVPLSDPLARVAGTSSIIAFHTDIFPGLALTEENPGIYATAYGMLADFVRASCGESLFLNDGFREISCRLHRTKSLQRSISLESVSNFLLSPKR